MLLVALGVAIGIAIGFIGRGDHKRRATNDQRDERIEQPSARAQGPVPRGKPWNAVVAAEVELPAKPDPDDEPAVREYRAEQAKLIVRGLRTLATRSETPLTRTPETAASKAWPYVEGWMSALQTVAPEVLEDVGDEIETTLCEPSTKPTEQMLLVRMAEHDPLFVSERGLDCTVARYLDGGAKADHVLWTALEAWDAADMPATPQLEALARANGDERTLHNIARIRGEVVAPPSEPMTVEEEARLEALAAQAQEPVPHGAIPPGATRPDAPAAATEGL